MVVNNIRDLLYVASLMGSAYQIQDQSETYFFTFQVVGWADLFSRQAYRDIILESFTYCRLNKGMELFAYVVMTNHIHCLMRSKTATLSGLVRDYKRHTAKKIMEAIDANSKESRREWLNMIFRYHAQRNNRAKDRQVWTHENHAVALATKDMLESRLDYIHMNPVRAGWVEAPEDYLYSSARNYAGKMPLIEIDFV